MDNLKSHSLRFLGPVGRLAGPLQIQTRLQKETDDDGQQPSQRILLQPRQALNESVDLGERRSAYRLQTKPSVAAQGSQHPYARNFTAGLIPITQPAAAWPNPRFPWLVSTLGRQGVKHIASGVLGSNPAHPAIGVPR